jgi:dihydroxyacetone kinase
MLTAAVCGDVFASPTVDAVLAGILAVTGPAGCLLIVKNYTGDRLNFGLAAARARSLGYKVELVIVGDDIALPDLLQPRGIAGTLFVHKIAGAMAREGADLKTIAGAARRTAARTKSFGMSLDTCEVPGSPKEDRIPVGKIELGLGIHGEPGVRQADFKNVRTALMSVCDSLAAAMIDGPNVVLVNNLGGTSNLEMSIIVHELIQSHLGNKISHIVGPATMMGSLGMHGVSISTYPATPQELELLVATVPLNTWPGVFSIAPVQTIPLSSKLEPMNFSASVNLLLSNKLSDCCKTLIASKTELNALDAKSGDGDTGSTVAKAAETLLAASEQLPFAEPSQLYKALAQILSQAMGGSSGILLSIFLATTGNALADGQTTIEALKLGLEEIMEIGGAKRGDRTMIDALEPALDSLIYGIEDAAVAARKGANLTSTMLKAGAGRASYVSADQLSGHIDPGAEAVARLFECLAENSLKKLP